MTKPTKKLTTYRASGARTGITRLGGIGRAHQLENLLLGNYSYAVLAMTT